MVISPPPPAPCTTRAAISHSSVGASAQASDAATNTPNATSSSRLRPSASPRQP